jgi:hypothetical protein
MHLRFFSVWLTAALIILTACKTTEIPEWESDYSYEGMEALDIQAHIAAEKYLRGHYRGDIHPAMSPLVRITRVIADVEKREIRIRLNDRFAEYPVRPALISAADSAIRAALPDVLQSFDIRLFAMDEPVSELIPNYYRGDPALYDSARLPVTGGPESEPFILHEDRPYRIPNGLDGRHIALWHSHGWYYNQHLGRWKWQRPRLFRTVEDILPMSFTLPYLVPMLESAGAYVWMPRERDTQHHEVLIDNDINAATLQEPAPATASAFTSAGTGHTGAGIYRESHSKPEFPWVQGSLSGFSPEGMPYRTTLNPFMGGTYRESVTDTLESAVVEWIPEIPEDGEYAVYVSFARSMTPYTTVDENLSSSASFTPGTGTRTTEPSFVFEPGYVFGLPDDRITTDALYTVNHAGGQTSFRINQQIGGGTWIYLGHFRFREGQNPATGSVRLSNRSATPGRRITADAVRFGGGLGIVERAGRTSGRPKYLEAARYYLQYAGIPGSLVWNLNDDINDYSDDFQSRGEWVNYLRGSPYGPNRDRSSGLGIPVELSLAFHTDAGVTRNDSIIGTLAIYSRIDSEDDILFPDSTSRLSNRDLSDIMQTQIVDDIRAMYDTTWTRRALRNSRYSESMRPNVPSVLLELLSHQNFRDMQYALDPRFRFDVSRSIYKSMLRFVADRHGYPYVVQPLPVTHMSSGFTGDTLQLSWRPQPDPLEPSARPDAYILYTRIEDGGFDNGIMVYDTTVTLTGLEPGVIYGYRVRAVNRGGAGFPSETLAVSLPSGRERPMLIINGFTRISGPAVINQPGFKGFAGFIDESVPDGYDIGFTGEQYNFNAWEPWIENDQPGHGASYADFETRIIPGNTFDFARIHGEAIREAGFGFVTVSEAAIESGLVDPGLYPLVNVILGMQRQIRNQTSYADSLAGLPFGIFGPGMRSFLRDIAANEGGIFISGAHTGTDLLDRPVPDTAAVSFAAGLLGYAPTTNHAVRTGEVFSEVSAGTHPSPASPVPVPTEATRDRQTAAPPQEDFDAGRFRFNTGYHPSIYRVDAPDAIKPAGNRSNTLLRYAENEFSAAVGYRGRHRTVIFGFPFETILGEGDRARVMRAVISYLR